MGGSTSANEVPTKPILPDVVSNPGAIYKWDNSAVQLIIGSTLTVVTELGYLGGELYQTYLDKLGRVFPEFIFSSIKKDYLYCLRTRYLGDVNTCCITDIRYYLVDGRAWHTCDPLTKSPGVSNICDGALLNYCVSNPINVSVCKTWYNGLNGRYINNDLTALTLIQHVFDEVSRSDVVNLFYDNVMDLYHQWSINNELFDKRLRERAQLNRDRYRCSFPLQDIINMANEYTTPRVCWDPNCTNATPGVLLTSDLVTRANCTITICNVEILKYVTSYKTYLDSSCTSKTKNQVNLVNVLNTFNKSRLEVVSVEYLALMAISVGLVISSMRISI